MVSTGLLKLPCSYLFLPYPPPTVYYENFQAYKKLGLYSKRPLTHHQILQLLAHPATPLFIHPSRHLPFWHISKKAASISLFNSWIVFKKFYWSIVDLQCDNLYCTAKVTQSCTHMFFSIMACQGRLNRVPCALHIRTLFIHPLYNSLHLLIPNSQSIPPHPLGNHKFILSVCESVCFIDKFICVLFEIPHISDIIWYLSFSFWLSMIISMAIHRW